MNVFTKLNWKRLYSWLAACFGMFRKLFDLSHFVHGKLSPFIVTFLYTFICFKHFTGFLKRLEFYLTKFLLHPIASMVSKVGFGLTFLKFTNLILRSEFYFSRTNFPNLSYYRYKRWFNIRLFRVEISSDLNY